MARYKFYIVFVLYCIQGQSR